LLRWAGATGGTKQSHVAELLQLELGVGPAAGEHLARDAQHAVVTDFENDHRVRSNRLGLALRLLWIS
jgi:hypothetical protein